MILVEERVGRSLAWVYSNNTARLVGKAFSLALLVTAAWQLTRVDLASAWAMVPASIAFWLVFAAYYLTGPTTEWFIYRRLWQSPEGLFPATLRKLAANELFIGLSGEASFYAWARKRHLTNPSPFAAIKDVSLLSGLVGNAAGFAALPYGLTLLPADDLPMIWLGTLALFGTSCALLLLRRRLLTLPARACAMIAALHALRTVVLTILTIALWWMILPEVPLQTWLNLAALRILVSRVPFIPNPDLVFAGLTVLIAGAAAPVTAVTATLATLLLAAHLVASALLSCASAPGKTA